jgi:hypothetical protein
MDKLTFKEYYESKELLRKAAESTPRVETEYEMLKYCQFPVLEEDEKEFIALKPRDRINILWEYLRTDEVPLPLRVEITSDDDTKRVFPCWGKSKLLTWIQKNTIEKK